MFDRVPLAWRNTTSDRKRLRRAATGIGFAAFLIFMQLGFLEAFLESALYALRSFDGDLVMQSPTRYQFAQREDFDRRRLYQAQAMPGVESVAPVFIEWGSSEWKSPVTDKAHVIRVIATDPDNPAFVLDGATAPLSTLKQANTVMVDARARRFLGTAVPGLKTNLAGRGIRIVGSFSMGPDFVNDGNLVMSDRTFLAFFDDPSSPGLRRKAVDYGVIKVSPGYSVAAVQAALNATLADDVIVMTKDRLIDLEIAFQNKLSPTGPIFSLGAVIGFLVGILISYQVLFSEISDRLHQFATLKAMGYGRRYLMGVIVVQSLLYGIAGFVPALLLAMGAFAAIGEWLLLPMRVSASACCWRCAPSQA